MADREHDGMKKCSKCGGLKPATAEYFDRNKTKADGLASQCKDCNAVYREKNKDRINEYHREYYQKNKDRINEYHNEYYQKNKDWLREYHREHHREYYQKNRDHYLEYNREYYQKNRDRALEYDREHRQTPAGRLVQSIYRLRQKTGATIYVRDMTDEEKETLANQYAAVRTLEKTEKELLAASGKKRCTRCDRVLDYDCFHKNKRGYDGLKACCKDCAAKKDSERRQKNKKKHLTKQNLSPIIGSR